MMGIKEGLEKLNQLQEEVWDIFNKIEVDAISNSKHLSLIRRIENKENKYLKEKAEIEKGWNAPGGKELEDRIVWEKQIKDYMKFLKKTKKELENIA